MFLDHPTLTATNSQTEPDRIERLNRVYGYVMALADRDGAVAALCQVDRTRWLTLSGPIHVEREPEAVADAVRRYAERYRQPRVNPLRVVLVVEVERVLSHV